MRAISAILLPSYKLQDAGPALTRSPSWSRAHGLRRASRWHGTEAEAARARPETQSALHFQMKPAKPQSLSSPTFSTASTHIKLDTSQMLLFRPSLAYVGSCSAFDNANLGNKSHEAQEIAGPKTPSARERPGGDAAQHHGGGYKGVCRQGFQRRPRRRDRRAHQDQQADDLLLLRRQGRPLHRRPGAVLPQHPQYRGDAGPGTEDSRGGAAQTRRLHLRLPERVTRTSFAW